MALLASEVQRLRYELGFNVLSVGAEPYIGVSQLFEQVIAPYLTSGAVTTSNTPVTAASAPTPVTLTLASITGVASGAVVIVDVDSLQERATIRNLSGSTIDVLLQKAHSGTYPVTVEGGESIIRAILTKLQVIAGLGDQDSALDEVLAVAGVKKVDEIEFFGGGSSAESPMQAVFRLREYWRDELASAIGIDRLNGGDSGAGSNLSVY